MERRAKYRVDTGPKKISMPPEELRNRRQKRHNNLVLHSEMPKRDWPNLRRSFSKYCVAQELPLPVRPSRQCPNYQKKYRAEHREELNEAAAKRKRLRRKLFPEKMRAASRREQRARMLRPEIRIRSNLSRRINKALKGICKSAGTISLIGCSIETFKTLLASLFAPGMTWENYGPVWHVDHIKPCAKFDLKDPEQQRLCFHWSNQQPLFAKDNIRKGDKYATSD